MGDEITIGVTEIVNNIEVTAQPNDQVIDINVTDNSDEVTLNVTPNVIEVNINKGSSFARWGSIFGNLTDQIDLTNALFNKADLVDGKVPSYQLPSFVDDVIEVANYAALPTVGEIGKIYITLDNNKIYRWSGSIYIEIASNQAIWGAITGTLSNQTDLQNALNLKADKSTTLTINGTTFDLSANRTYTIPTHDAVTLGTANGLSLSGQVLSLGLSGASSTGALSSTDWNTFNGKQNALGYTAANDANVVKLTGDQTITGTKSFNSSTSIGIRQNNSGNGYGIYSENASNGFGYYVANNGSGKAISVANALGSFGNMFEGSYNGTNNYSVNYLGEITGSKFTRIGGTSSQFLKADGSLDSSTYLTSLSGAVLTSTDQTISNTKTFLNSQKFEDTLNLKRVSSISLFSGYSGITADVNGFYLSNSNTKYAYLNFSTMSTSRSFTLPDTNGVFALGSGTTNYLAKWSNGNTIANSLIFDNGTGVGIGTTSPFTVTNQTSLTLDGLNASRLDMFSGGVRRAGFYADSGISNLGSVTAIPLTFSTSDTERMRITSSGNVGIGTGSPSGGIGTTSTGTLLDIYDGTAIGNNGGALVLSALGNSSRKLNLGQIRTILTDGTVGAEKGDMAFSTMTGSTLSERMRITSGGNVGIGTTSPSHKLSVVAPFQGIAMSWTDNASNTGYLRIRGAAAAIGADDNLFLETQGATRAIIYANGNYQFFGSNISDARAKENINSLDFNAIEKVMALQAKSYYMKNDNEKLKYGFIAQDVYEVLPDLVNGDLEEEGFVGLDYNGIIPILVQSIQELKAEIELLKQK